MMGLVGPFVQIALSHENRLSLTAVTATLAILAFRYLEGSARRSGMLGRY